MSSRPLLRAHSAALCAIFATLAIAKGIAPSQLETYLAVQFNWAASLAAGIAGFVILVEASLAVLALIGVFWRPARVWVALITTVACVLTLLVLALPQHTADCGCFGGLSEATRLRRVVLILCCAYFSMGLLQEWLATRAMGPREPRRSLRG